MFAGHPSVRPPCFVFVDISRTMRCFYIKLGMRVYPGGIILCLDFTVTWLKVTYVRSMIMEVMPVKISKFQSCYAGTS